MRDSLLLVLLVGGCLWTLKSPWIGGIMWTVVSLGSPHILFGYSAANWPVSMAVAGVTLAGLAYKKDRINPFFNGAVVMTAVLVAWMTVTLPFSFVPEYCYDPWDRTFKITLMLIATIALTTDRKKLDVFIWANVVAIGYYGVKGGVFTILTGGGGRVLGAGGFIAENNALALAEIVVVPLLRYLQLQVRNKWLSAAMIAAMVLIVFSALGSQSRGALIGMVAMMSFFWVKSRNKFIWGIAIVFIGVAVLVAMPDEYWQRMNTIKEYDTDDSSQGRINSWWTAFHIANDRITGGGFRTNIQWVYDMYAPNPRFLLVEHSIYFQMLGEFGWIGLFLFLSIGVWTWINASRLVSLGKSRPELAWAGHLGAMVQVSMIGYGVTGAFLSLALFDLPYNIMAIAALGLRFALAQARALDPLAPVPGWAQPRVGARAMPTPSTMNRTTGRGP